MYFFKIETEIKINKTIASETIGITRPYLSDVLNGKKFCSKVVAYCITKYIDENAEIEDYFEKKGE